MSTLIAPETSGNLHEEFRTFTTDVSKGDEENYYSKINGLWVRLPSFGFFGALIYDTNVKTFGGDILFTTSEARGSGIEVYVRYDNNPLGARLCVWDWQYDSSVAETLICPLSNQSFINEFTHQLSVNNMRVNVLYFYSFYNQDMRSNQLRLINRDGKHILVYTSVVQGLPSQLPDTTWSFFEHKRLKTEPIVTSPPYVPNVLGCLNIQLLANNGQWIKPEWGQTEVVPPQQNDSNYTLIVTEPNNWVIKRK